MSLQDIKLMAQILVNFSFFDDVLLDDISCISLLQELLQLSLSENP